MCGISAIIKTKDHPLDAGAFRKMNDLVRHRGPDGEGFEYFASADARQWEATTHSQNWQVALGHRRLSIIDLSETGRQPMSYDRGKIWITYNGEIYNYLELRRELEQHGHAFAGTSDTEVILAAYKEWGTRCFSRLRGMWGIVIFDSIQNKLVACRDRMGIKPLYYYCKGGMVAFASEIKQLASLPGFKARTDKAVVKEYLLTGFERTDRTFFDEVKPVLPGTFLEIGIGDLHFSAPVSFWTPEEIRPTISAREEAARLFYDSFRESIGIHLRSDVPVGCQLSGGLDSSAVFVMMEQLCKGEHLHTFTISFPDFDRDETPFAKAVLKGKKACPHFATPAPEDFMSFFSDFIWHHDEPVGSFSHFAGYALAQLISEQKIKVVLNGQGADEILGGYWQMYFSHLLGQFRKGNLPDVAAHALGALLPGGNGHLLRQASFISRRFSSKKKNTVQLSFKNGYESTPTLGHMNDYLEMSELERRVFDIRQLILPRLLKWDDRNLMAFSVEGRYPFLDHELIETCLQFKTKPLYYRGWTKYPLRLSFKEKLPASIAYRKSKWGFETPQEQWLKNELSSFMRSMEQQERPLFDLIEPSNYRAAVKSFLENQSREQGQLVFRMVLMDKWLEKFSVAV